MAVKGRNYSNYLTVPSLKNRKVLELCGRISKGELIYIQTDKYPGYEEKECFKNVTRHIELNGGKMQLGWVLWEHPHVMIEAEFHAIWESENGKLLDITPHKPLYPKNVLFLVDKKHKVPERGAKIKNIRMALDCHEETLSYLMILDEIFEFEERNSEGNKFILKSPQSIEDYNKLRTKRISIEKRLLERLKKVRRHGRVKS